MKLQEAHGKAVRITMTDGEVFIGLAYDYISALDNDPDPASITIGNIELFEPEIKSIEPVD